METQNITLSLPKVVLRKMKLLASKKQTSVSRLFTQAIEKMLSEETDYEAARKRQVDLMGIGFELGFRKLTDRDELHER